MRGSSAVLAGAGYEGMLMNRPLGSTSFLRIPGTSLDGFSVTGISPSGLRS